MKKILKRILIIFFAFVNLTCCYCYADEVDPGFLHIINETRNPEYANDTNTTNNDDQDLKTTLLISGGAVLLVVGLSVFILTNLKHKD